MMDFLRKLASQTGWHTGEQDYQNGIAEWGTKPGPVQSAEYHGTSYVKVPWRDRPLYLLGEGLGREIASLINEAHLRGGKLGR